VTLLVLALPLGCSSTPPGDTPAPDTFVDAETGVLSGGESGVEEDDHISDGYCLPLPQEGVKGYRHHCGGNLNFTVEGEYNHLLNGWTALPPVDMTVGFGPTYASEWLEQDDVYETPLVAACCGGPFDFESTDSGYPTAYILNCLLDAVQQICHALPKYFEALGDQKSGAQQQALWDVAIHLNQEAIQTDCLLTLMEENAPQNSILNRTWQIVSDTNLKADITIDVLEILEWDYPENPNDVEECDSILDNDDNVAPLVDGLAAGDVENLDIMAGDSSLTNNDDITEALDPGSASLLSLVEHVASGDLEIRNFVLRDNDLVTIVVDSIPVVVDRWSLRLLLPVTTSPVLGNFLYSAGSMSFVASAVYMGEVISLVGTNVGTVYVYADGPSWVVQGLEVEYNDNGTLWSFSTTSDLEFQ
jgi:hypothetical protein